MKANIGFDTIFRLESAIHEGFMPNPPIAANSVTKLFVKGCWKNDFEGRQYEIFYIFEYDTLQKYRNMNIPSNIKDSILRTRVLKRYDLVYEDIKNLNWTLNYP